MSAEIILPGDIISYSQMCVAEGYSLQRGMNFRVKGGPTVILMSIRKGAPYADEVTDNGNTLIYEGHDVAKNEHPLPKSVDQPLYTANGTLTANGKFYNAAIDYLAGKQAPELIKVYEKIKDGIWVFNGVFELLDAWKEIIGTRNVFKFKLKITDRSIDEKTNNNKDIDHNRMIPSSVKIEVWKRDKGKCRECGSMDNLHFDHILPYSKGGTSLKSENIQLLCARHNLSKSAKIQ